MTAGTATLALTLTAVTSSSMVADTSVQATRIDTNDMRIYNFDKYGKYTQTLTPKEQPL